MTESPTIEVTRTRGARAQRAVEALERAQLRAADVAAIGITNQRETTVVWHRKTGRPIGNAIVWQDRRTAPMCDRLKADGLDRVVRRKTGLVLDAYFSGTKLQWMLRHIKGAREQAKAGELALFPHHGFWFCMDTFKEAQALNEMWNGGERPWKIWKD